MFPLEWFKENWSITPDTQIRIFLTLALLLLTIILRYITIKLTLNRLDNIKDRYYWTKGIQFTYVIVFLILLLFIWLNQFKSLATIIGLISAGLTVALKDLIVNAVGWFFIVIKRPFSIGDRVQIGDMIGDVIDMRFFQFTLNEIGNWVDADQSTGRIIHVPNGKIFTEAQFNFTQGFSHIWNEIGVLITFESNWKLAKELLGKIVDKHAAHLSKAAEKKLLEASKKYMIIYSKLTPIVYTSVKDSGVLLTMRYLITPRRRRTSEELIWEDVLETFEEHDDIELAYPTQRIYYPKNGD